MIRQAHHKQKNTPQPEAFIIGSEGEVKIYFHFNRANRFEAPLIIRTFACPSKVIRRRRTCHSETLVKNGLFFEKILYPDPLTKNRLFLINKQPRKIGCL